MAELSREAIENAAWDADIDIDSGIYWNYSGRWYLKSDFNIVGSTSDLARFLVQLAQADQMGAEAAWDMAQNIATDSMGRDTIFSFPDLKVPDKPEGSGTNGGH